MVTTATKTGEREKVTQAEGVLDISTVRPRGGRPPRGPNGRGPNGGGPGGGGPGGGGGDDRPRRELSHDRYRIGVLVGVASILMMFTALASAYVVRSGLPTSFDWKPVNLPSFVWVSTALIVVSSVTFSVAKRALARGDEAAYRLWLSVTLALGFGFLASQFLAWRQFVARGVYLASNPHSSFFYVFTGLHALHLLGGILALAFLLAYARRGAAAGGPKRRVLTDAAGIYWHFMDFLWVSIFLLLLLWR